MVVALQIALVNTSRFSKLNGVPGSVKEFDFQGVLQLRNVLTERGLRNIQLSAARDMLFSLAMVKKYSGFRLITIK